VREKGRDNTKIHVHKVSTGVGRKEGRKEVNTWRRTMGMVARKARMVTTAYMFWGPVGVVCVCVVWWCVGGDGQGCV
jgi:hypothetical protein